MQIKPDEGLRIYPEMEKARLLAALFKNYPLFLVWQVQREIVPWFGDLYFQADEQLSSNQALERA
jgi:hypothetical protein